MPQYGGFCAFAISCGRIAPVQPDRWAVQDNRLYLNTLIAQQLRELDWSVNIKPDNSNWPLVLKVPLTAG